MVPLFAPLYHTCEKLPLDIFVDCLIHGDLSGLGQGDMQPVWDKIYLQSLDLSNSGSYNETWECMKEINDLRAKITEATAIIDYLQMVYDDELVGFLNQMGLRCILTPEDTGDVIIEKLNGVVGRMKKWFPRLSQREAELKEMQKEGGQKIGADYFDNWLEVITQQWGVMVRAADITVARFYRAVNKISQRAAVESVKNKI